LSFVICPEWLIAKREDAMQDLDKVLNAAASCKDLDMMMQGVQVASKLIACHSGWLDQHRDDTWAALWHALVTEDRQRFCPQHDPGAMRGDLATGWVEYVSCVFPLSVPTISTSFCC
jgi:hypothetical protein